MACDQSPEALVMVWSRSALGANRHRRLGKHSKVNDTEGKGISTVCFEYKSIHCDGTWVATTIFSAISW